MGDERGKMKHTYLSETIAALEDLGGKAHFNQIYNRILERNNLDFSNAQTPDATIRRTLQVNRADHPNSQSNTFYSVYGVDARKGYWGLVKYQQDTNMFPNEIDADLFIEEGAKKTVVVNKYERNQSARIACIEKYGAKCYICGFDFGEKYGSNFMGKIHVHHIVPISSIGHSYKLNPKTDLIPICPNCHFVIHMKGKNEAYSVEELKSMINGKK